MTENRSLINNDGNPVYGYHKYPLTNLDITGFKNRAGRVKRWVFAGVSRPEFIFGAAVVNLGYLSNIFCYVFDRKDKKLTEYDFKHLSDKTAVFSGNGENGSVDYKDKNGSARFILDKGALSLSINIKEKLLAELRFARQEQSLNLITRTKPGGFNYTLKEAGLLAEGTLKSAGREYGVGTDMPSGSLDYTYGILKRNTSWNWASGSGFSGGRKIGFNFSKGINENGFNENVFWVDGKMVNTGRVEFVFDGKKPLEPWKITSEDGKVDLVFTPEGERAMDFNVFIIKSFYHQPFGSFSGKLRGGDNVYELDKVSGVTEDHKAVW